MLLQALGARVSHTNGTTRSISGSFDTIGHLSGERTVNRPTTVLEKKIHAQSSIAFACSRES